LASERRKQKVDVKYKLALKEAIGLADTVVKGPSCCLFSPMKSAMPLVEPYLLAYATRTFIPPHFEKLPEHYLG
jgi:hypothetical protein